MKKLIRRALSLTCALVLAFTLVPFARAADTSKLPRGWWPVWEAYEKALASGDTEQIIRTGDAVLTFFSGYPLDVNIGELSVNIRQKRLDLLYYENKGDYAAAIDNTEKLRDLAEYMNQNSDINYDDTYTRCVIHLDLLAPFTGVYAASCTQQNRYGSKLAPASGSLYGSVFQGALADNGSGTGSIASVYVELERETAKQFDYLIRPIAAGGQTLQINLNYENKGATARALPGGVYDSTLEETLAYLGTLSCPVLLRIGGEMNIWGNPQQITDDYVTPDDFIRSYRYIADKARALCPRVELVWSPMYICRWGEDFGDFWPGDAYVDWVGCSLYYNYDRNDSEAIYWLEATRSMQFTDPLLSAKTLTAFARQHGKPVAVTESGAYKNGSRGAVYAEDLTAKAFADLTMVYPEIKSIVYFDMNINEINGLHDYTMNGSLLAKARAAIDANPSLLARGASSAATYVPLEQFNENVSAQDGKIVLGAAGYTYNDRSMTVSYALDGAAIPCSGASNRCVLDTKILPTGAHTLAVTFRDSKGYSETKSYRIDITSAGVVQCSVGTAGTRVAFRKTQEIDLDGRKITLPTFAIEELGGQANYVRVRDLAAVMNGTAGQYNVGWDGAAFAIDLKAKTPYTTMNGSELAPPFTTDMAYANNTSKILVNGAETPMQAFVLTDANGNGHTYFKLRDLGKALGFNVDWTAARGMFIESGKPYGG